MEYGDILERVNRQKNLGKVNSKLFWYVGLIQAIELFSQKLNFEQVVYTCMESINELLLIEKSAIYVQQDEKYVLKRNKGYTNCVSEIHNSQSLKDLPVFHAGLLHEEAAKKYFGEKLIKDMEVRMVVPLIIENSLFGFILIGKKIEGDYDKDDYVLAEALMRLFNNALENYKKYLDIERINKELDEKVFNLFAINQASKVLLSELDIFRLYNLAVDVFSELTQSSVTGFVLHDKESGRLILKAYRNVLKVNEKVGLVVRCNKHARVDPYRIILNTDDREDMVYLKNIFPDYEEMIGKLHAKFFVLLVRKQEVVGVVTLGTSITAQEYKTSMFELIESLATSTYIAVSNAELFGKVKEQKELINKKLENMIMLNNLIKNINSSKSLDVMAQLVLRTLGIAFKVNKGLIANYNKEKKCFTIIDTLGFKTRKKRLDYTDAWKRVFEGDTVFEGRKSGVKSYIRSEFIEDVEDISGILISPIFLEGVESVDILGVIVVFKYNEVLISDEESTVIVDTISNHIAPVMASFRRLEVQSRTMIPNYVELFKQDLADAVLEAKKYSLELEVVSIKLNRKFSFRQSTHFEILRKFYKKVYPVSYNNVLLINGSGSEETEGDIKSKIGENIEVKVYRLGREFDSYDSFMRLFEV